MPKTDRSSSNASKRFIYGFLVTSLASLLLLLPFAPRTQKAVVAGASLACTVSGGGESLDELLPSQVWNEIITPDLLLRTSDEAELFGESVDLPRRAEYLKSHFVLQTKTGDSPGQSFAMVRLQYPDQETAIRFTERLLQHAIDIGSQLGSPKAVAQVDRMSANQRDQFETIAVVHKRGNGSAKFANDSQESIFQESRRLVQQASLQLFAPMQATPGQDSEIGADSDELEMTELEKAREDLKIARNRHRALYDLAGEQSSLTQHLAAEVLRFESIVRDLEFAATPLAMSQTDVGETDYDTEAISSKVEVTANSSDISEVREKRTPMRFVARSTVAASSADDRTFEISIAQPPQIIRKIPHGISRRGLLALLPMTAAIGLIVGFCSTRRQKTPAMVSKSDVEAAIESPVIGSVFPTRKQPAKSESTFAMMVGVILMKVSELSLFAVVAFVGVCAATEGTFLRNFVENPLATYTASIDQHLLRRINPQTPQTGAEPLDDDQDKADESA